MAQCFTTTFATVAADTIFHTHSRLYRYIVGEENDKQIYTSFARVDTYIDDTQAVPC